MATRKEYDQAAARYAAACEKVATVRAETFRMLTEADEEFDDAAAALRLHEITPGIPLCEVSGHREALAGVFAEAFGKHTAAGLRLIAGGTDA